MGRFVGGKCMSNYLHTHESGHISELLFKWRNLCKYSQQGWVALNAAIKTFFFRRTNHGGCAGPLARKSKLKAMSRWLQRRMIFMCGFGEEDIINYKFTEQVVVNNEEIEDVLE